MPYHGLLSISRQGVRQMKTTKRRALATAMLSATLAAGCSSSGPVRRVSDPAASIQQMTIHTDGNWSIDLRIDNFSSIPMRFQTVSVQLTTAGQDAGALRGNAEISIAPESADVIPLTIAPHPSAKIAVASALADGRSIDYAFKGQITAAPADGKGKAKTFQIKRDSRLSQAPGLTGVLR